MAKLDLSLQYREDFAKSLLDVDGRCLECCWPIEVTFTNLDR